MYELIDLAFKTDSTRVAIYMIGKELSAGISDYLARAVGLLQTHKLSHETKKPDGWKNFGTYCRFQAEEFARFAAKLKSPPEPAGEGPLLDNSLLLFGSAPSAFQSSRNYPLVLVGGKKMGFKHGQDLNHAGGGAFRGNGKPGDIEPWIIKSTREELPLSYLYATMLQKLGVGTDSFGDSTGTLSNVRP
jgi:hypothetical protein